MKKTSMLCVLNKAQYRTGEQVEIRLPEQVKAVQVELWRLQNVRKFTADVPVGKLVLSDLPRGNYGICLNWDGRVWESAFDVVDTPSIVTRYGFLSDFSIKDVDEADVAWMKALHLNAIQFYDWMYRHDQLLPEAQTYEDPLGRALFLPAIQEKIRACRQMGIRPFAYGAVYAATEQTATEHRDWCMYTMDKTPMRFADWLYYMNISANCGWPEYLLSQYRKVIAELGFQGIHMDTYGFPKRVWDADGRPVELAEEFPRLIEQAALAVREQDAQAGVIFNAVNNWPVESVAETAQDAVYIEVWPPNDHYYDLYSMIQQAKLLAHKSVILAAYLKPFRENALEAAESALRLCFAAIAASGGTQLIFGEQHSVLSDSYYASYSHLRPEFLPTVQKYCDFLVRYADLLYNDDGMDVSRTASGGINEDVLLSAGDCEFSTCGEPGKLWTILRESPKRVTLHLVNLIGNDAAWNTGKQPPMETPSVQLHLRLDRAVTGAYCASPDWASLQARPIVFSCRHTEQGRVYELSIPSVQYWNAIWIETE